MRVWGGRKTMIAAALLSLAASPPHILVMGDSWGTDIAGGMDAGGVSAFDRKLREKGCNFTATSIAIPGTKTNDWDTAGMLDMVKVLSKKADYVWITLMGNDALAEMPACARTGKSAQECGNEFIGNVFRHMLPILDAIRVANAKTRVVGFGYDILFSGAACLPIAKSVFPQCWNTTSTTNTTAELDPESTKCFNTQFVRIQELWQEFASDLHWVDTIDVLGTTQAAGGFPGTAPGKPDLTKFAPDGFFPIELGCIHPSLLPLETSGAMAIMDEFHKQYFASKLGC